MSVRPSLNHRPTPKQPDSKLLPAVVPDSLSAPDLSRKSRSTVQGYRPPSRQGKRAAVAWLEPEAIKQLNIYAIQNGRNVQDLLVEAINDWFAREGLSRFDSVSGDAG